MMGILNKTLWVAFAASAVVLSGPAALAQAALPTGGTKTLNAPAKAHVIRFSGYDWEVRPDGMGGPGPNHWGADNVSVDRQGRLHLKLTHQSGIWHCAEVTTLHSFGFGRYQFQVTGALDRLDPNVVFGLFNYPPPAVGPDGTNEIDIEYSRWGDPSALPASATIYPAQKGPAPVSHPFPMPPGLSDTTQRFDWQSGGIAFNSLRGHRDDNQGEYAHWSYRPADSRQHVPQQPLPVHINLWLMRGKAPQDGKEVEVIIQKVSFITASP